MSGLDALSKKKKVRHFDDGGWTGADFSNPYGFSSSDTTNIASPYFDANAFLGGSASGGADPIGGLYQSVLGRAPDPEGLAFWQGALSSGQSLSDIESAFRSSPEAQSLNIASPNFNPQAYIEAGGGTWNPSPTVNAADIEALYGSVLGRGSDPAGLAYWTEQANKGASLQAIESAFRSSPEFVNLQTIENVFGAPAIINTGGGLTSSGVPYENISSAIASTLADTNLSAKEQADKIYNVANQLGVTEQDIAAALGIPLTQVESYFQNREDYPITEAYKTYLGGRTPDLEGLQFWRSQLEAGKAPEQIAAEIARSEEARGLRAGELAGLFTTQFGTDFVNSLSKEEMNRFADIFSDITAKQQYTAPVGESTFDRDFYLQNNPDVARAGIDPYGHYLEYGFREGRAPNAEGPDVMNASQRYEQVLREAALDPELGAAMKAKDPMLYYSLTPLVSDPNQQRTTERIRYGEHGFTNVDGVDLPNLNARVAESWFGGAHSGTMQDFSHHRGNYTRDLGWTSNSASNSVAKGADALGVTKYASDVYGNQYQGLEEAARLLNIDPSQFQDKQVQAVSQPGFNEYGQYVPGGEPLFNVDEVGNRTPVMQTISAQDQLYDAVGNASKDIYRVTMDSLTPGKAVEGGAQSFNTVFYQKAGDYLVPISKPQEHGGMQNAAVYQPKDFGFGYYAQGPMLVGTAAIAFAGPAFVGALGNVLTGAAAAATPTAGAMLAGSVAIGAATGAVGSAISGGDVMQGALKGGVLAGVSASMPTILNNIPGMDSLTNGIASAFNFDAKDVSNVIGSTLARTLATAANGADGDQILKSFGVALASSGLGATAANGVRDLMAGEFTMEQIEAMARATQLVTNAATTSALSGANTNQIVNSVITSLVQGSGSIKEAADAGARLDEQQATTPFGTENVGFTTGAVDAVLQEPIYRQDILDNASDPIAAMNAMNNWTGDSRSNMQYLATDLINQGMPRQELVDSFKSVFRMDEPSANAFIQETAARAALTELANKSDDPIAMFNAGAMLTGDKKQNVDLVVKEMVSQGLSKGEISKNLQDIFRVPEDKADAYATQITKDQPFTSKATTFGEAFKEARTAGVKEFEYEGKRFNTNLASDKVEQIATKEAQTGTLPQDAGRAPSWSGLIKSTAPVPGLKSAVDQPMETTPFGPMTTSQAPSFMGQAQSIATRAATQQEVNNYLAQNNPPVAIDPQNKTVVQSIADFYKDSLLGTAGQYIESIGNLRTYLSQVAVAHGLISPDNSFVVSSKAMQQVGEAIIPPELKQSQANIVRSIDQAESVPGKIVSGIVSAIENPRGASLFVGGALVEAGFSLGVGAAATAFTGLASTGIATASLIQGAQSFGAKYDQLVEAGVDRDKAMLPSYVSGLITTVTSGIANVPIFRAFTGPATSVGTSASRDLVLRNITGEGAEQIVQASIPVFVAAGVSRDFATEYMDELLGGMATEYILEGTVTPSRYQTEAVLAGLIDVGANAAVRMPFEFANRVGVETDTTRQAPEQELKEYTVPLLEYQPSAAPAQIGYTPTISPEGATNSVVETRNNSAQQLFDNLDITPDEAINASTKGIGATVIESINAESTNKSTQIDPGALIVEDAFGNPITYADAIGAIVTESPIIDLSVGTKEQQMTNADLLQSVFETLNIDPRNAMVAQTQMQPDVLPRETELAFKERPDIRNLFNVETLFPEAEVKPVTDIQLTNQVDTNLANDLATKVDTGTATATDLALANDLAVKIETQLQQATDVATKQNLANDLQVVTDLINKINLAVQTPTDIAVQPPVNVQPPVDIDISVPPGVTVQTPKQIEEEKKRRRRRRTPQAQRALQLIDLESGIFDLGPAFTRARTDYTLAGQFASGGKVALPFYDKIAPRYDVFGMAMDPNTGGQGILGGGAIFDPKSPFVGSNIRMPKLTVGTTKKNLNYELAGYPNLARTALNYAEGGAVPEGHNPQFFSEGGLNSLENRYVNGEGDGTSDSVPAMLANGEFVIPADVVSSLGNGSNEAGANVLDEFLQVIREHKQKHDAKQLPPDSKGALAYLLDAKKRA